MEKPVVFFGTLQDEDLFEIVVGQGLKSFQQRPCNVPGFILRRANIQPYPVLKVQAGEAAPGLAVFGLSPVQLERLAFYETVEYDLKSITAEIDGKTVSAQAFLVNTEVMDASGQSWDISEWRDDIKASALIEANIAMGHFGKLTRQEIEDIWLDIAAQAQEILNASGE